MGKASDYRSKRHAIASRLAHPHRDVQWVMRENLKKARLQRMDAAWVQKIERAINR